MSPPARAPGLLFTPGVMGLPAGPIQHQSLAIFTALERESPYQPSIQRARILGEQAQLKEQAMGGGASLAPARLADLTAESGELCPR